MYFVFTLKLQAWATSVGNADFAPWKGHGSCIPSTLNPPLGFRSYIPSTLNPKFVLWYCLQVVDSLKRGYQVMVFVHSRKDTGKTARWLAENAATHGETALFTEEEHPRLGLIQKEVRK